MASASLTSELAEHFGQGKHGCGLCSLWAREEESLVAKMSKEGAPTNSELREKVIAATGFCNRHTHLMNKDDTFGGNATAQLVLKKLEGDLSAVLDQVKGAGSGFGKEQFGGVIGKLEKTFYGDTVCPICDRLLKSDKDRMAALLQMLENKEGAGAYAKSEALCIPHFVSVMKLFPSVQVKEREAVWSLLMKTEQARLGAVDKLLNDRMQKYSWDFKDVGLTPEEAGAQRTGNSALSGVEGLYTRNRKTSLRPAREK